MRRVRKLVGIPALLLLAACGSEPEGGGEGGAVGELLGGGDTAGYARASGERVFTFPDDHGPHPAYRQEWWYFTGNLESEQGRRLGYQITLFRTAVAPAVPELDSAWATNQVWMGHLAVTDPESGRFVFDERFARGALGQAGARAEPFAAWLGDWRMEGGEAGAPPFHIRAEAEELAIDLTLDPGKPAVLQGDGGLSQKGPEAGNASWYYSLPRLPTRGTVRVEDEAWSVEGRSWLDREWSTSALGEGQTGWDWFSLQLDDGRDLMIYRIRQADGEPAPQSYATWVDAEGEREPDLDFAAIELEPVDYWQSPETGSRYPVEWRLELPGEEEAWTVRAVQPAQELRTFVTYWEGAVDVVAEGEAIGRGYLEMTGYTDSSDDSSRSSR
ncbi:MAG: lipocalin-like domain-containing protein [Thiohalospira sp.]